MRRNKISDEKLQPFSTASSEYKTTTDKYNTPLFYIDLAMNDSSKTIFDITSTPHTKIKVKEPHKR